jgi:hypothetical protein
VGQSAPVRPGPTVIGWVRRGRSDPGRRPVDLEQTQVRHMDAVRGLADPFAPAVDQLARHRVGMQDGCTIQTAWLSAHWGHLARTSVAGDHAVSACTAAY